MISKYFEAGKLGGAISFRRSTGHRSFGLAAFAGHNGAHWVASVGRFSASVVLDWSRGLPALRARRDKILGPLRKIRDAIAARIERIPIVFNFYPYGAGADFALGANVLVNPFDVEFLFAAGRNTFSVSYVRKIPIVE